MKTKKTNTTKPWAGSESLEYVKRFAPSLIEQRASLLPFANVICGGSAGPQPQAKDYDPKEEPYFYIEVNHPHYRNLQYIITVKAAYAVAELIEWKDGDCVMREDAGAMTMPQLWEFLRQLPRDLRDFNRP